MKMDVNVNMQYDFIIDAANINCTMRYLKLSPSLEEKDKLIDELLLRRLEKIRDDLFYQGIAALKTQLGEQKNDGNATT